MSEASTFPFASCCSGLGLVSSSAASTSGAGLLQARLLLQTPRSQRVDHLLANSLPLLLEDPLHVLALQRQLALEHQLHLFELALRESVGSSRRSLLRGRW